MAQAEQQQQQQQLDDKVKSLGGEALRERTLALLESDVGGATAARDHGGRTLLHFAAIQGVVDLCEMLLERGADVNAVDGQGQSAMHLAAQNRHRAVLVALLSFTPPPLPTTSAAAAASDEDDESKHEAATKRRKADVTLADAFGRVLLHWCCHHGWADLSASALTSTTMHAKTQSGDTPLHWAAQGDHQECVELLISNGVDCSLANDRGQRADHLTSSPVIRALIESKLPQVSFAVTSAAAAAAAAAANDSVGGSNMAQSALAGLGADSGSGGSSGGGKMKIKLKSKNKRKKKKMNISLNKRSS